MLSFKPRKLAVGSLSWPQTASIKLIKSFKLLPWDRFREVPFPIFETAPHLACLIILEASPEYAWVITSRTTLVAFLVVAPMFALPGRAHGCANSASDAPLLQGNDSRVVRKGHDAKSTHRRRLSATSYSTEKRIIQRQRLWQHGWFWPWTQLWVRSYENFSAETLNRRLTCDVLL